VASYRFSGIKDVSIGAAPADDVVQRMHSEACSEAGVICKQVIVLRCRTSSSKPLLCSDSSSFVR
jgi:hypothetical protein